MEEEKTTEEMDLYWQDFSPYLQSNEADLMLVNADSNCQVMMRKANRWAC